MKRTSVGILVSITALMTIHASCKSNQASGLDEASELSSSEARETVMYPGMKVVAKTKYGPILIEAGEGFQRTYVWDQGKCRRSAELWPRTERWYGSYGIYYPGPGDHWKSCQGISRGVLEEGQMHFETQEEANAWVEDSLKPCANSGVTGCEVLVSQEGLVFEFAKVPNRRQISVSLFQVFIKGEKAQRLPAAGDALTVEK